MLRILSGFTFLTLIFYVYGEKKVPDRACFIKPSEESMQDGCYKDLKVNLLANDTIRGAFIKCLKDGDPEAYKRVPDFPETEDMKMSTKMIEECEDTFKWIAAVEMCIRIDVGAYDTSTQQIVPWRINELINQLLSCSDQKKDEITSVIDLCFAETEDKKGWDHVLLFNACKFKRLAEFCPENKYMYDEWQKRNTEWKELPEEDGDVVKEISNHL